MIRYQLNEFVLFLYKDIGFALWDVIIESITAWSNLTGSFMRDLYTREVVQMSCSTIVWPRGYVNIHMAGGDEIIRSYSKIDLQLRMTAACELLDAI